MSLIDLIEKAEVKIRESKKEGKLKATATVDFGDFVIKGFRIMDSQYENPQGQKLWIQPPSFKTGETYQRIFYVPDEELWKLLEEKIWKAYYDEWQ